MSVGSTLEEGTMIVYVLGAPDPEMALIERYLRDSGLPVAYATSAGRRVTPPSAYRADGTDPALPEGSQIILVECDGTLDHCRVAGRVDHHRPGDPGYGRPPEEFLAASSLGQVFLRLQIPDGRYEPTPGGWEAVSGDTRVPVPGEVVLGAAADHCLAAAYARQCHGVTPEALLGWRLRTRAEHQGVSVRELEARVRAARRALAAAPTVELGGLLVADMRPGGGAPCGAHGADCPGDTAECWGDVPELPEAAARDGRPFIAVPRPPAPGSRRKVVLQAAPPAAVQALLDGALDLEEVYGDPARGFAGGYARA